MWAVIISGDDAWIADSGASCHMTPECSKMYNIRPPPPGREAIMVRDGRRLQVECVGSIDMIFHGHTDVHHTLFDVSYVPDLGFILLITCYSEDPCNRF